MKQVTKLNKWHNVTNKGDSFVTYTRDSWTIPEAGTEIWCTGWSHNETRSIRPYGDGCHVVVGADNIYHCDQLMEILDLWQRDGYDWGINVPMEREQRINGWWTSVKTLN